MSSALERLIYVASTRDYNSSRYYHAGLEARFGVNAAVAALVYAHEESFATVTFMPLAKLAGELNRYIEKSHERPEVFLNSWQKLEPFRVTIPLHADPIAADLFISNLKLALAVVKHRLRTDPPLPSISSPPPSLDPRSQLQSHN
jgi:hypothetical protein